ncbi:MAG TPA: GNAT family N-acetyltransferase [Beijerinckiaceae bacterium]|nr:GNAT family N-acetyltransferase [Beijerinckiaceae bacterium]
MPRSGWRLETISGLAEIDSADWDSCAVPESVSQAPQANDTSREPADSASEAPESSWQEDPLNPFVSYAFLLSLEESGCVGDSTGWHPLHQVLRDETGRIAAVVPCYAKSHSQGEYVFDHGWADAFERAGGRYYPKLQIAVPFTPVTGPRLLIRNGVDRAAARAVLAEALLRLPEKLGASSIHATFLQGADAAALETAGWLIRQDRQFHWNNDGYRSFDDFLARLSSRKRKAIRRERAEALAPGIVVEALTGSSISEGDWDAFFAFYMDTGSRKWGRPYLNRRFFSLIAERMAEKIVLIIARREGRPIAGAINFLGRNTLYGRNWGAIEHHPFLHFEVCYYQAIDYAIRRGLARVEAGAQGEHKLARGYVPTTIQSAHGIVHPGFRRAVAEYLAREREHVSEDTRELAALAPFRRDQA